MVDANKDIGTFRNLTATNLYGAIMTANQPNITAVGTLGSLDVTGNISGTLITGTLSTAAQPNITSLGTLTAALYTTYTNNTTSSTIYQRWTNSVATNIVTDLWMSNVGSTIGTNSAHPFRIQTAGAARIYIDASGNVNIGTAAPTGTYKLEGASANFTTLYQNGTQVATSTDVSYLSGVTPGTAATNKALVADSSLNIGGINSLSATSLTGPLVTAAQPNITSVGTLSSLSLSGAGITHTQSAGGNVASFTNSAAVSTFTIGIASSGGACDLRTTTASDLYLGANTSRRIAIKSGGNVGINTTIQGYQLDVSGDVNSTGVYRISGTDISTAITGITPGIVSASKALIADSSSAISGMTKIITQNATASNWLNNSIASSYEIVVASIVNTDTTQLGSCIAFQNNTALNAVPDAAITLNRISSTQSDLVFCTRNSTTCNQAARITTDKAFCVNTSSTSSQMTVFGSQSFLDGSYERIITAKSDNVDPIIFDVQLHSGSGLTTTNAAIIGTFSNNDLGFQTGDSRKMTLKYSTGYLGIGTTSPSAPLSVSGTASNTFNVGGAPYALGGTSSYGTSLLGPVTVSVSATFGGPIQCSSIYCTSDRRAKENIQLLDESYCDNVYKADVFTYNYIGSEETIPKIGFIAQDLNRLGYMNLLTLTPNENMKKVNEDDIDGAQMNIDYNKITAINFMMMKKLIKRIEELEATLSQ
ncbi:TPA: hypothetical protein N0F65_005833 [Lagenidium giganteum]|uniref:Peptidase S74 domain-containing protein n=1 Tax=Lagenidium giganteum TaxID=4803 RepID=A0AAV2YFF8_9STRA|nr:TPA: hypothetical protein N0F65_005833 [Lagenidium giganteum]